MDECRRIGIADIDLIPEVTELARLEIACDERGLARTGRRTHPDDRARGRFVEERVEARPRDRVVELWPREFGEGGRADGYGATDEACDRARPTR